MTAQQQFPQSPTGRRRRIEKVFYPVFPPDRNADDVIAWLKERRR